MLPHKDKEEKQARYGGMNRGRYKEKVERESQERKNNRFGGVRDQ